MKDSLTKKVGPLPVWIWAAIAFILVWYYRNKLSGASNLTTSSTTPGTIPPTLSPIPLSPGESVYDPNTGLLTNTPQATGAVGVPPDPGTATSADIGASMDNLANAIASGMTVSTVSTPTPAGTTTVPTKRATKKRRVKSKPKPASTKVRAGGGSSKPRSATHVKTSTRAKPHHTTAPTRGHARTVTPAASRPTSRSRPKTPMTQQVTRQRPVASHPTHPEAHNTPHQQTGSRRTAPRKHRG